MHECKVIYAMYTILTVTILKYKSFSTYVAFNEVYKAMIFIENEITLFVEKSSKTTVFLVYLVCLHFLIPTNTLITFSTEWSQS